MTKPINARAALLACTWTALGAPFAAFGADAAAPDGASRTASPFSFELGVGDEYDSNVAVLDIDASSNAGDTAALLDFGVSYDKPGATKWDFKAGYNFSDALHRDFDEFDLRIDRGSATVSYDLGRLDAGVMQQYAVADLAGDRFLTLSQTSPYVSKLIGKRLFLRFAYAYTEKTFPSDALRNATTDTVSADAYVFLNGLKTYVAFGAAHDHENAVAGEFDYAGEKFNAQLTHRFMAGTRELTLKSYVRFEGRGYGAPTPSIGVPRRDDRVQVEASLDVPLGKRTLVRVSAKHANNGSNLPSVDFAENVLSVGFSATL